MAAEMSNEGRDQVRDAQSGRVDAAARGDKGRLVSGEEELLGEWRSDTSAELSDESAKDRTNRRVRGHGCAWKRHGWVVVPGEEDAFPSKAQAEALRPCRRRRRCDWRHRGRCGLLRCQKTWISSLPRSASSLDWSRPLGVASPRPFAMAQCGFVAVSGHLIGDACA